MIVFFFITSRFDRTEPQLTFLSYDSLYLAYFISNRLGVLAFSSDRALDMCSGIGIQTFFVSPFCHSVLGIDINPYAVQLADINASLNHFCNCEFRNSSLFENLNGQFDLIIANPPFISSEMPVNEAVDSIGGEPFGLGITVNILTNLPRFLMKNGKAFLITRTPVFNSGDYLLKKLSDWLPGNFGWIYHYISDSVCPLGPYERKFGIKNYRQVILELFIGNHREFRSCSFWHRKTHLF